MAKNYLDTFVLPNNSTYYFRDNEAIGSLTRTGDSLIVTNRIGTSLTIPNTDFDTINVTELNAGNLIVTGAARFLNPINGSITGQAGSVANSLVIQLNSGTTEGTNKFTYNGSSAKTVNITKSGIGLGNVENKSSATIRGEITSSNVTTALGYTPLNKAGDTMTGPLKFGDQAIPQFSGSPSYILGIEAFASGGDVKWQSASSVSVGSSTKATQDESGNNIKSSYGASLGQDSSDGHKIFLKNKNGTQIGSTITIPDNNTTYTFAESSSNGYFTVTPSGGSAQSVKIHGLGTSAFKNTTDTYSETGTDPVTGKALKQALDGLPEPMVFKGTVGSSSATYTWDQLPTPSADNDGWTFKAIENHSTAPVCKNGDTLISNGSEWVIVPSGDEPSGTVTSVAISNGGGLSVSGSPITSSGTITISHSDTSSQASVSNSGRTYIQSVTLDTYGHVTKLTSATETVTDTNYYHKTGTWSGLTYTAAKVGSPDDLAFTIPTGTTATTVALGNHNHDSVYLKLSGGTMTGQIKTSFKSAVAIGSRQSDAATVDALMEDVRYSSGCIGSVSIGTAYTKNGITIPTGWYNYEWIPHRSGGVNGEASGDNCNYGKLYLSHMTTPGSGTYEISFASSSIAQVRMISSFTTAPSDTQVVVADGVRGGVKTSGYTIAKSVPSNAVFTDTTYTIGTSGNSVTLTPSSGSAQSITVPYATSAGSATKATQDESGNNIKATYASSFDISDHTITLKNKNGDSLDTVTVPDNNTTYGLSASNDNITLTAGGTGTTVQAHLCYNIAIGNTTDWNTLQNAGAYKVQMSSWGDADTYHSPNSYKSNLYSFGMLYVIKSGVSAENRIFQYYIPHSTSYPILVRSHNSSTSWDNGWSTWYPIYNGMTLAKENIGSASAGTAISADDITSWSAGTLPTLGTAISADDITAWDAGSTPTLGTAISADDITAWSAGTMFSASFDGKCTLSLTSGSVPSLSYTGRSIPNVTSVGSVPSLSYTARSIPNVTGVGTLPDLKYTARSIPNISVSSKTVVTGIS